MKWREKRSSWILKRNRKNPIFDAGRNLKWNGANCTQTEIAEKVGVSLPYVNRIIRGREQIVNKTFVKMMDELGYDVEITYKKRQPTEAAANRDR